MKDYLFGYIRSVSSELDRFQKGPNHPKGEDKQITGEDLTIPEVGQQTEWAPEVGPEEGPVE